MNILSLQKLNNNSRVASPASVVSIICGLGN